MAGHHRIPLKITPRLSMSCLNRANDRRNLIIEAEEKPYCSSVSIAWWNECRDYRGF